MIDGLFVAGRVKKDGSGQGIGDGCRAICGGRNERLSSGEPLWKHSFPQYLASSSGS